MQKFCQYCINKGVYPQFPRIVAAGAKKILSELFFEEQALFQPGITSEMVDGLRNYPDVQSILFGSKSKKKLKNVI